MKPLVLAFALVLVSGCASTPPAASTVATPAKPIDGSSILIKKDLRFLPSLSDYLLPAGIYLPVSRDAHGVFYQSPTGIAALGPWGGPHYPVGGIYRFRYKDGSIGFKVWHQT